MTDRSTIGKSMNPNSSDESDDSESPDLTNYVKVVPKVHAAKNGKFTVAALSNASKGAVSAPSAVTIAENPPSNGASGTAVPAAAMARATPQSALTPMSWIPRLWNKLDSGGSHSENEATLKILRGDPKLAVIADAIRNMSSASASVASTSAIASAHVAVPVPACRTNAVVPRGGAKATPSSSGPSSLSTTVPVPIRKKPGPKPKQAKSKAPALAPARAPAPVPVRAPAPAPARKATLPPPLPLRAPKRHKEDSNSEDDSGSLSGGSMSSDELDEDSDELDEDSGESDARDESDAAVFNVMQPLKKRPRVNDQIKTTDAASRSRESDMGSSASTANARDGKSDACLQTTMEVVESLESSLKDDSAASQFPPSSLRLISSAVNTLKTASGTNVDACTKLEAAANTARLLAEALSAVCVNGRASHELASLRETTRALGDLWKCILPELETVRDTAKKHADEAAALERTTDALMHSKKGMIDIITKAFSR